jgi:Tfp pilus assembly protein PilF
LFRAISENPSCAHAHFNLAVIYDTAQPPSKEQAKKHYALAISLNVQPDAALEKLLR